MLHRVLACCLSFLLSSACAAGPANPVARENALPGTESWRLQNPALEHEIEGYASAGSVAAGETISFHVSTGAPAFSIAVYRMGYYGGAGARLMGARQGIAGRLQHTPCLNRQGLVECDWKPSLSWRVPRKGEGAWESGVYLAKLTTEDRRRKDSYILFVVRDDAREARYVMLLPTSTYQAYNYWGGQSLYTGCTNFSFSWECPDGRRAAPAVSFNRPYAPSSNPAAAYGAGAGEFLTNVQPVHEGYGISSAGWDYNLLRWIEREGYDVKYIASVDLHANAAALAGAAAFISTGHDEYYSGAMRARLEEALAGGLNLGFFSSNQMYWQVRFTDGSYGRERANRVMTAYRIERPKCLPVLSYIGVERLTLCYRRHKDPVQEPLLTTGMFRELGRPEAGLIGNQYTANPPLSGVTVAEPHHWLFNRAAVRAGSVLKGLRGYEVNSYVPGVSPAGTVLLTQSASEDGTSHTTYYIAPSHAQVFAVESMQWSWGLDDFNAPLLREDFRSASVEQITRNVFGALGEQDLVRLTAPDGGLALAAQSNWGEAGHSPVTGALDPADRTGHWRLLAAGTAGRHLLVSRSSGKCLASRGESGEAQLADCDGDRRQAWKVEGAGAVRLIDAGGMCLTRRGALWLAPAVAACRDDAPGQLWSRAAAPWRRPANR